GACAVQFGTALLRSPDAKMPAAYADALVELEPEGTVPTRAFSGRLGRAVLNDYVNATMAPDAPKPAPYPVQRGLATPMRDAAGRAGDAQHMQIWAGQAAAMARAEPAADFVRRVWQDAERLLP
ncbi:MAG: nitronate monooxygenase, partial [Pseudolabrys sp.]